MDEKQGNLIFSYSRKNALDDGVLIDITELAFECGFKLNTAINDRLYNHYKEETRTRDLEDLLITFLLKINRAMKGPYQDRLFTKVDGEDVVLHIGPGDEGEPVLTLCYSVDL